MEMFGIKLGTVAVVAIVVSALNLGAACLGFVAVSKFQDTLAAIGQSIREERDAHWQFEIQKANNASVIYQCHANIVPFEEPKMCNIVDRLETMYFRIVVSFSYDRKYIHLASPKRIE